jgi:uncharacterized protein YdeI (YjbR/CyaY-like superfamily)
MAEPILFSSPEAFEQWLLQHGATEKEIWLKLAKKTAAPQTLNYAQAVEVALCFGWIDGVKKTLDETHFIERFSPRQASSPWSKINKDKIETLSKQGRMREGGLAAVALAKVNGHWDRAYAGSATMEIPQDLALMLKSNPRAAAFFETLNRQNRYAILYRIDAVKKPETRARKIEQFVAMLAKGETIYP